ncbi:MAG: DHH family phosphoesterase [Christensenellales bacterium]|jgi:phosphoesterase RecJ-like protein
MTNSLLKISRALKSAAKIALFTHLSPDGDALGSALALKIALDNMGKECSLFCEDPAPEKYSFMPLAEKIITAPGKAADFDMAVSVDAADEFRLGTQKDFFMSFENSACLDHHGTNTGFAKLNYIDSTKASSAELVLRLLDQLKVSLTDDIRLCLFIGVSTDTFHFSFNNTTSETLAAAARMVYPGMDMDSLTGRVYRFRPLKKTKLMGQVLSSIKEYCGGKIITMTSTDEQRRECGALDEDYEGIINYGIESTGVKIAILARAIDSGNIKMSFRSKGELDVGELAAMFGGGGHKNASGCTVAGADIDEIAQTVAEKAKGLLK